MLILLLILGVVIVAASWPYVATHAANRRRLTDGIAQTRHSLDEPAAGLLRVHETLQRDVELVRNGLSPEESTRILHTVEEDLRRADDLIRRHTDLNRLAGDKGHGFRLRTLGEADHTWRRLAEEVRAVLSRLDEHEARLSRAVADTARLPQRLREAEAVLGEVAAAADAAQAEGFAVAGDARVLDTAPERLAEVRSLVGSQRLLAAVGPTNELADELSAARDGLLALRRRHGALTGRVADLRAEQERLAARARTADATHALLLDHHAPSNAEGVAERLAEGRHELERADTLLTEAVAATAAKDVRRAEQAAAGARAAHESAEAALTAPEERLARVRELTRSLPYEVRVQTDRVDQMHERASRTQETGPLVPLAAALRAALDRLDLAADRPEWLVMEARLAETTTLVDALGQAVDGVDRIARRAREQQARTTRELHALREAVERRSSPAIAYLLPPADNSDLHRDLGLDRRDGWPH
jgi:chromosome segregation ATPase